MVRIVENPKKRPNGTIFTVEWSVEKRYPKPVVFHGVLGVHIAHNLSTSNIHQKWIIE